MDTGVKVLCVWTLWMWFALNNNGWTLPPTFVVHGTPHNMHKAGKDIRARLVGSFLHQGRVEVQIDRQWGAVCGSENGWHIVDAHVLCRQLGFPTALLALINGPGEGPTLMDQVECVGQESNLGHCPHSSSRNCQQGKATALCQGAPLPVRAEGTVEILYDSHWIPVCQGLGEASMAEVICRQLGFKYLVSVRGRQGTAYSKDQLFLDFECDGQEAYLAQCRTSGPRVRECTLAEVICSNNNSGKAGEIIRLAESDFKGTGQVQVNFMGEWWSICLHGFDRTAAKLACEQLGFQYASTLQGKTMSYGRIPKPAGYGTIKCKGTETFLKECDHYLDASYVCPSGILAEISCTDNGETVLPDYQVRIVGGYFPYEGRVEVSYNGQWGTVCDDGWGYADAEVVCQQLGFYAVEAVASTAYFGEGNGPIWLDDVACLGNETSIINCQHAGIGNHNCNHNEDAGVRCQENQTQFSPLPPGKKDSILPLIVILINGLIALLILFGCIVYCYLKLWDRYTGHTRRAHLRHTQDASTQGANDIPLEYTDEPPSYNTVQENREVYITQRPETPPPEYDEAIKLQAEVRA